MAVNPFLQRKKDILSKSDKSSIGKWDKPIVPLCNKINKSNNYYTTSSCSGRVVLMIDQKKKSPSLFLAVSHDTISFKWLKDSLDKIKNKEVKFKCEPPILHVACKDLDSAKSLLEKAKKSGLKHSGIHSIGKNIILEINGSDKLEFPIKIKEKTLVDDNFLKLIVKQSNEKLKKSWKTIKELKNKV